MKVYTFNVQSTTCQFYLNKAVKIGKVGTDQVCHATETSRNTTTEMHPLDLASCKSLVTLWGTDSEKWWGVG